MNSQTVAFDPLPTINCPSGNITVCGTYSPPPTGGPYTIVSTIELSGNGLLVSGGNQFLTTLTATTFCLTIPTNILNGSTVGNYELLIDFLFVQVNPPFAQFSAASTNGTNPTGADIFYSTTCPIIANDDNTTVNQCSGGSINVITNDLIFGNPATTSNVVVTQLTTSPVVTFNATTGIASIPAGTPPGTYNFTYRICNPVNASQCDPATVSFIVAPQPVVAVNDVRSIAICSSNTTTSVLSNDTICGTAFSSPVIVSFVGTVSINGATINNLGVITVPSNTASGTYTLSYRVCHANAPTSCSTTATVTLTIVNLSLQAVNDNFTTTAISGCNGGSTATSVFANDSICGGAVTATNATVTLLNNGGITGASINNAGFISIPAGSAAGNYVLTYRICQAGVPTNCSTNATVSITVANAPLIAGNDNFSLSTINSCIGGSTATSVFANDTYCGGVATATNVTVALLNNGGINGATINSAGFISIPEGSAAGNYVLTYRICQAGVPTNCSTNATVSITVANATLIAGNDNFTSTLINTLTGGTTASIFSNDFLNGVIVTNSSVVVSLVSVTLADLSPVTIFGLAINPNGTIFILDGTPVGTYIIKYQIAQIGCATNTVQASATIQVIDQILQTPTLVAGIRANKSVNLIDTQSTGKIIIAGNFTTYNNQPNRSIARLNTDLTLDTTIPFLATGYYQQDDFYGNQPPYDLKVINNSGANFNKILVVGRFPSFNGGSNGQGIARLMPNGGIDPTFNAAYTGVNKGCSGINFTIHTCFVYPDNDINGNAGKILIGGMFDKYNNTPMTRIARLMPDGSLDLSFNPNIYFTNGSVAGPGFTSRPNKFLLQSGKIVVGGYFSHFNGVKVNGITRLNNDGSHDITFNSNNTSEARGITSALADPDTFSFSNHIQDMVLQSNNSIIIGGQFQKYNGVSRNNIARITSTGALDNTFNVGVGFNNNLFNVPSSTYGCVKSLTLVNTSATETRLYVAGDFTKYKGSNVQEVIRLVCTSTSFPIGSVDIGFSMAGEGTNGQVWCVKKQDDGKLIIGGLFTTYDFYAASNITRIFPTVSSNQSRNVTTFYDSEPEIDLFVNDEVIIYPNPSNGKINFSTTGFQNRFISIEVTTTLGQKVFIEHDVDSNSNSLDLSSLSKGTYFVSFIDKIKKVTKAIIIN